MFYSLVILFTALFTLGGLPPKIDMPDLNAGELGQWVDPFIGTGGLPWVTGMLHPGATVPFGTVKLSPDTCYAGGFDPFPSNGYYFEHRYTLGFSHTMLEGGNFRVTPAAGNADPSKRMKNPLPFLHEQEIATAGYYAVALPTVGCLAEMTATTHVGAHRYTFNTAKDAHLFIDATSFLRDGRAQDGKITIDPDAMEVTGEACVFASFTGRYGGLTGYFVAQFDKPLKSFATWTDGTSEKDSLTATGDDVGADLNFGDISGEPVELKVGLSFVSLENARLNLEAETDGLDFEDIRDLSRDAWEENLSKILIDSGDDSIKTIFYTGLYHSLVMPVNFTDVNGDFLGFSKQVKNTGGDFTYYTDMSLWDTFRTVHPLFTLVAPDIQLDSVKSLIEMAKIGGALPRWPSGGGYTHSMFGSPADMVITESYLKGITGFDVEAAYGFMKKVSEQGMPGGVDGRESVNEYNLYGYIPHDVQDRGSVSSTLEYAWADGCIALLGEALGKDAAEVQIYKDKSMRFNNLFDPDTKYFRPKNSDGSWVTPFSPNITSYYNEVLTMFPKAYAEGSAQHYRWHAPLYPQELISLFGGNDCFVKELDKFMSSASRTMAAIDPGPGYWQGNQHNMHALYLFNDAGRPDLTQKWARWALSDRYGLGADGLDGNDDAGTLSAWYVLSALGIYPVAGTDRYWIGSPNVNGAVLDLGVGKTLTVTVNNQSAKNVYVKSVTLNGVKLDEMSVTHAMLTAQNNNALVFEMGPKPL